VALGLKHADLNNVNWQYLEKFAIGLRFGQQLSNTQHLRLDTQVPDRRL